MNIKIFIITVLLSSALQLFAQNMEAQNQIGKEELLRTLKELDSNYRSKPVSFSFRYTYRSENEPNQILDSLTGEAEINKTKYWFVIDSTETIGNEKYTITLFKEDKLMYLTKSVSKFAYSPSNYIDSSLYHTNGFTITGRFSGGLKMIDIGFPQGQPYKKISLAIDTLTGYVAKVKMEVKTEEMMEGKDAAVINQLGEYSIIEGDYYNYSNNAIEDERFDEKTFFVRTGKNFEPTEKYSDFKIFIGTLNL